MTGQCSECLSPADDRGLLSCDVCQAPLCRGPDESTAHDSTLVRELLEGESVCVTEHEARCRAAEAVAEGYDDPAYRERLGVLFDGLLLGGE